MTDLNNRQSANVRGFEKVDRKEKHLVYIHFFENGNGGAGVLAEHHRYRSVLIHAGLEWQHALGMSSEVCMLRDPRSTADQATSEQGKTI